MSLEEKTAEIRRLKAMMMAQKQKFKEQLDVTLTSLTCEVII
jgi:hypothetical protein